jgi:hypothetical protein
MTRQVGGRLTNGARRRAIRQLQSLVGAGVGDDEAREQVMKTFDVSSRTSRYWLQKAYEEMAAEAEVDRRQLVGLALKRRRIAAARALRDGDTRAYIAACDSEARLLGLDAPARMQHTVLVEKISDMSKTVIEVVKDYFADDPAGRDRFVGMLRTRLNAQLTARPEKLPVVIDVESGDVQAAAGVVASEPPDPGPGPVPQGSTPTVDASPPD